MRAAVWSGCLLAAIGCRAEPPRPVAAPGAGAAVPVEAEGLHNVFRVSDRIYSGNSPEGEAGFASLERFGVRTVISVDGAAPDVEAARRHGLRYVHLPVGYDGIPPGRVAELVKAADLPGPVYVHCHHGKHRGPAAVAAIHLCADPAWDAEAWFRAAGTDPRYAGLIGVARTLVRPTPEELARVPADFPASAPVADLARIMVEVDRRWDNLKRAKASGWKGADAHEALQLAELFREAGRLDSMKRRGPAHVSLMAEAEAAAEALEAGLRAHDATQTAEAFARSSAACATCHAKHRDTPGARE